MVDRRLPAPATGLPALMNSENKILQIDTKWSEMRKKHKTDDTKFLPVVASVPAAGGRPFLPLEKVNTSYHSEFQQTQSINVVGEHFFQKTMPFTFPKFFLVILIGKKICKSIPNGLKHVKNT